MRRTGWENENWDFDGPRRGGRYMRGCGFPPFGLVFGVVSFAITLAFKIVEMVFQLLFRLITGSSTEMESRSNKPAGNPAYEHGKEAAPSRNRDNVREFRRTEERKTEQKGPETKDSNRPKEDHGKDIYVIIFILTVIPGILMLAAGKPLYAGAVALAGFTLLIIAGLIKGAAGKAKKKNTAKFEETEEQGKDDDIEKLIKEAFEKLFEIKKDIAKVEDGEERAKLEAICVTAEKIIGEVRTNPESLANVRKFFYYYLDAFAEIVKKYLRLSIFEESSEEIGKLVAETEKSFSDIDGIFKDLCEKLLEKDMLHLKAELNVIKNSN